MITTRWAFRVGGIALATLALGACQPLLKPAPPMRTVAFGVTGAPPTRKPDVLRVYYIDVGNGMCHVIRCPGSGKRAIVDDCGSTDSTLAMPGEDVVAEVRSLIKGYQIDLVLSHTDLDHQRYVGEIFYGFDTKKIRSIWAGGNFASYDAAIQGLMRTVAANKGSDVRVNGATTHGIEGFTEGWHGDTAGAPVDALQCDKAKTYVLTVDSGTSANASSLMLMLSYAGRKLVFPGDATAVAEYAAIDNFEHNPDKTFLYTDVLETSHHGAGSGDAPKSNTEKWALATEPRMLVSSAGWKSNYRHPQCAALERYTTAEGARMSGSNDEHALWCGTKKGASWTKTSPEKFANYSTASNGEIVVDVGPESPRGKLTLYYQYDAKLGAPPPSD